MIERPSLRWRRALAEETAAVAAGSLPREEACAADLWPPGFTDAVDVALQAYEREVRSLRPLDHDAIWAAVERVTLALNAADADGHIETGEREELCRYVADVLTDAGVDVAALTGDPGDLDLTGEWRDW